MSTLMRNCEAAAMEEGAGRIIIRGIDDWDDRQISTGLHGPAIKNLLDEVMTLALSRATYPRVITVANFGEIAQDEAIDLLPQLIRAAAAAVSDVEKYERVFQRSDEDHPDEPLCHQCGLGSRLPTLGDRWSELCEIRGHRAYAAPAAQSWDGASEQYDRDVESHQFRLKMGLIPPMEPLRRGLRQDGK